MLSVKWDSDIVREVTKRYLKNIAANDKMNAYMNARYRNTGWENFALDGFIAEALVQNHYGVPIHYPDTVADCGWDMVLCGIKVDIKNASSPLMYFSGPTAKWTIKDEDGKPLKADRYLFTQMDKGTKSLAIIGWASKEDILNKCRFYHKGEPLGVNDKKGNPIVSNCDGYRVNLSDIRLLNYRL